MRCFLQGPTSRDLDVEVELALGRLGRRPRSVPRRLGRRGRAESWSCSPVLIAGPSSGDHRAGMAWAAITHPTRSSVSRQPGWHRIQKSGRWDLNPRQPRWQRGALPLSYSRDQTRRELAPAGGQCHPRGQCAASEILASIETQPGIASRFHPPNQRESIATVRRPARQGRATPGAHRPGNICGPWRKIRLRARLLRDSLI